MIYNIYLIDDDWRKFLYIPSLIDCLNRQYPAINFVNGFQNLSRFDRDYAKNKPLEELQNEVYPLVVNILRDPEFVYSFINDPNGIFLIDYQLSPESSETADQIIEFIQEQDTDQDISLLGNEIFEVIGNNDNFWLSSIILAWCKIKNLKYVIISSIGQGSTAGLKRLNIITNFVSFPNRALNVLREDSFSDDLNETLNQLTDAIISTILPPLTYEEFLKMIERLDPHKEKEKAFELLQRFICIPDISLLKSNDTLEVLKTISGEVEGKSDDFPAESLSYAGAWLLMLGKFRHLFPNEDWQAIFSMDEFITASKNGRYCKLHPQQSKGLRMETLRVLGKFFDEVFIHRDLENKKCILEKVRIEINQEQNQIKEASLSLKLGFPLGNFDTNQRANFELDGRIPSLYERIYEKSIKAALSNNISQGCHGTSESIWQLWTLCSFSDVCDPGYGVFGTQHRMNIFKLDEKSCVIGWGTDRGTDRWINLWL